MNLAETYENLNSSEYELEITEVSQLTPRNLAGTVIPLLTHAEVRLFLPETCTWVTIATDGIGVSLKLQEWRFGDCYDCTERWYPHLLDAWAAVFAANVPS